MLSLQPNDLDQTIANGTDRVVILAMLSLLGIIVPPLLIAGNIAWISANKLSTKAKAYGVALPPSVGYSKSVGIVTTLVLVVWLVVLLVATRSHIGPVLVF